MFNENAVENVSENICSKDAGKQNKVLSFQDGSTIIKFRRWASLSKN